jgi:exopolysaccharide production protein ExoQ
VVGSAKILSPSPARSLEWIVAACALFLLTNALDRGLHALSAAGASLPLARAIVIPFYAAALLALARSPRQAATAAAAAWPVLLLVVLAAASSLWSTDPPVTVRWVAGLLGTTTVGIFLAVRFDVTEQLEIVCAALGTAVVASALVAIVWPAVGIRGDNWLGVFEENNLLGRAMGLSTLAFIVLALERRERRVVAAGGCTIAVMLLLESRSLTARLVAATCLIAMSAAVFLLRRGRSASTRRPVVLAALAVLFVASLAIHGGGRSRPLLERDASLSGRTRLWSQTLQMAGERLWFGHGYGTFWSRAQVEADRLSYRRTGQPVRHPHNGLLEILFELGLLGVLGFAIPFVLLLRRALALTAAPAAHLWPLAYLLFLALSSVAESDLLRHKIFWALYVALAVDLLGGAYGGRQARPADG